MSEVQGSILVVDEQFFFSLWGKNSMIAKKFLSVAKMASLVYERESCIAAIVKRKHQITELRRRKQPHSSLNKNPVSLPGIRGPGNEVSNHT